MKMAITIVAALLCSVCLLMLTPMHEASDTADPEAQVRADLLSHKDVLKSKDFSNASIKLLPYKDINLYLREDESYLGRFKIARSGNIYLTSYPSDLSSARIIKITSGETQERQVLVNIQEGDLMGIDIDEDENIYGALTFPNRTGAIYIWASDGQLLSKINTKRFLPAEVKIVSKKQIWAVGQKYDSSGKTPKDVQVRVYGITGMLLNVLLGGLKPGDITFSVLINGIESPQLISNDSRVVYDFFENECIGSHSYPFQSTDELISITSNGRSQSVANSVVRGVMKVQDKVIWYGNVRDPKNPNVYTKSFVGLTTKFGEPITPQMALDLPEQYGNIVGVDHKGFIYISYKENSQLNLKKMRIEINSAEDLRPVFQTDNSERSN